MLKKGKKMTKQIGNKVMLSIFKVANNIGLLKYMNDRQYSELKYMLVTGERLNLDEPKSFNEKIQWLKIYDHNSEYTKLVDKYKVKQYISDTLGKEYVIPLVGGPWESFDEIDFEQLPNRFVLKTNNGSGAVVIVKDKKKFERKKAKKILDRALKKNYYYSEREWPYKNVKPLIFAEQLIVDESGDQLKDYKVFTFGGEPKIIQVDYDRFNGHKRNLYDVNWKYINGSIQFPTYKDRVINKPICFDEMISVAKILARGIPHVRVDFYVVGENLYFGEMTFYHGAGIEKFTPKKLEFEMGSWINLPQKK
jgi:hypothetical protein